MEQRHHRRSAQSRREQALRAKARSIQRFLKGFAQLHLHRGSQPSRFGAAIASALTAEKVFLDMPIPQQQLSRHFIAGNCTWGDKCRFSHTTVVQTSQSCTPSHQGFADVQLSPSSNSFPTALHSFVKHPQSITPLHTSQAGFDVQTSQSSTNELSSMSSSFLGDPIPGSLAQTSLSSPLVPGTQLGATSSSDVQTPQSSTTGSLVQTSLSSFLVSGTQHGASCQVYPWPPCRFKIHSS